MSISCASPSSQFRSYQEEIEKEVLNVLRGSSYILGKNVSLFEQDFASYIGTKYAVGVANGTDAISLALQSCGIGFGDEVITVSHTAVATVAAIEAVHATPILVDINSRTLTIDINLIEKAITKNTKAVIAVHLYGQGPEIHNLINLCQRHSILLIEDVSQAHGAKFSTKRLGSFGDIGCFSCYPTKNLGAIGDAGIITTNSEVIHQKLIMLREYGWKERFYSIIPGTNSRLDEIQAAILRVKLKYLDQDNQKRIDIAHLYTNLLSGLPLELPSIAPSCTHVFHQYVIQLSCRDALMQFLSSKKIFAGIHYKYPIHKQPAYQKLLLHHHLTVTEHVSQRILSLPIYPELSHEDATLVAAEIRNFFNQ